MSKSAFGKIMRGLEEAKAYMDGERDGYRVTVPPLVDVKSIRKGLKMTQAAFSDRFGFSLDSVENWEGGVGHLRRRPAPTSLQSNGTRPPFWKHSPCCNGDGVRRSMGRRMTTGLR